jgi:hypothetical protein
MPGIGFYRRRSSALRWSTFGPFRPSVAPCRIEGVSSSGGGGDLASAQRTGPHQGIID